MNTDGGRVSEPRRTNTGSIILPGSPLEASIRAVLHGSRWLVAEGDPNATLAIVAGLESMGCVVRCIDAEGRKVPQLGPFDAQIVLSDSAQDARLLGERLRTHPGVRWASVLRFAWPTLWMPGESTPNVALLATRAHALLEADRALAELVRSGPDRFTPSVETLGPVRTLRALCTHGDVLRVHFAAADRQARVEVGGGLILNASFQGSDGRLLTGEEAFASVLELVHAEVTVERRERPELLSLVAPVEEALALAMMSRGPRFDLQPPRPLPAVLPPVAPAEPRSREALASRPAPQARVAANTLDDRPRRFGPGTALAGAVIGATLGVLIAYRATREPPAPEPRALTTSQLAVPAAPAPAAAPQRPVASTPTELPRRPASAEPPEPPPDATARELERQVRAALATGQTSQAVRWAERALAMRKKRWEYRVLLGDALAADGQPERALRLYAAALARRPGERHILERIERVRGRPGS